MPPKPPGSSLTVLGGPLDGTVFRLADSGELLIGSDARCGLRLMLTGVSPIHARLRLGPGQALASTEPGSPAALFVNDEALSGSQPLHHGDVLWLGPPGGEHSVMLQCRLTAPAAAVAPQTRPAAPPAPPAAEASSADPFFVVEPAVPAPADDFFVLEPGAPPVESAASAPPVPLVLPQVPSHQDAPPELGAGPAARADDEPAAVFEAPDPGAVFEAPEATPPAPAPPPAPTPPARPAAARPPAAVDREGGRAPTPPAAPRPRPMPERRSGAVRVPTATPPAPRPAASRVPLAAGLALVVLAALGAAGWFAWQWLKTPQLRSLEPGRARTGQTVVLSGAHFAATPDANTVRFGSQPGRVLKAGADRLEVAVPDLDLAPGSDTRVAVVVEVAGRASGPIDVTVYQGPRLHGLLPDVALPGEIVELRGAGWTAGAVVRFGQYEAQILELRADAIRVRVPEIAGPPGTEAPVTVAMGEAASNPGPFFVGRLPLIVKLEPAAAAPGDVVTVTGKGFDTRPGGVVARVGGRPALLLAATEGSLRLVVPRVEPGLGQLEVELPAEGLVNQAELSVTGTLADPVDFQFVAEPFEEDPTRAALTSALGPTFVLAASGGKSAAARALEAQKRLNAAAGPLKAALEADLEARDFASGHPTIALKGQAAELLEVTAEDAAGYDQAPGRAGAPHKAVTPGRLAVWWTAVARDLVLLLLRNEKPQHAAELAPEGRVLAELQAASRKLTHWGVPRQALAAAKPPLLAALRQLGTRVPPAVPEPAGSPAAAQATAVERALQAFKLDGEWRGRETVPEGSRYITLYFQGKTGTFELASGPGVGFPLTRLEQPQRGSVRFSIFVAGGLRTYDGRFDGQKLAGTISAGPGGAALGTFELVPR